MKICNARLFLPDGSLQPGSVEFENDLITHVLPGDNSAPAAGDLDAGGFILSPGWIEIQINGGFGLDFSNEPTSLWQVASGFPQYGVTAFLPTVITSPAETYRLALEVLRQGPPAGWTGSIPLGYHFEGPFLNPGKKGAHNPDWLRLPERDFCREWSKENGVRLVTMAPELPGALDLAAELIGRGITLSAGHSLATFEDAGNAAAVGYTAATHLFNAMPPLDHRSPGLAAAALLDPRLTPGLIVDGIHVHPEMVKLAWRLKGPHGIALITDAMAALGVPPGVFVQAGMEVVVDGNSARLRNGTLAGSILSHDKAVQNLMAITGEELTAILPALTSTPARLLNLPDRGVIQPTFRADFTLLEPSGTVVWTMVGGKRIYNRN